MANYSRAKQHWLEILGLSLIPLRIFGINSWETCYEETRSMWCSQRQLITQQVTILIFSFSLEQSWDRRGSALTIASWNLSLSGPSVIDPNAISAEYLFFQLSIWILVSTNYNTGCRISFLMSCDNCCKQFPAAMKWPISSSSSSCSKFIIDMPFNTIWIRLSWQDSMYFMHGPFFCIRSFSSSISVVQNSKAWQPIFSAGLEDALEVTWHILAK